MSKINVEVFGTAKYYPLGMFEDPEEVVDATVVVESATEQPKQADAGYSAVVDFLKALMARDAQAPSFGSASSFKDGQKEGSLVITPVDCAVMVRVYHQKASELNLEVSGGDYLGKDGQLTDEPWHTELLMPGEVLSVKLIESNAVTAAFYF